MLAFAVFDPSGTPATSFDLTQAYAFGAEDVPVPGTPRFASGHIHVDRSNDDAAGLAVQFRVEGSGGFLGELALQTCLIPDRDEPYLLSLELARHRIMLFLNKLEDWDMFDVPADDPIMLQFEAGRIAFTKALVLGSGATPDLKAADALARESLFRTVDAGERLALTHAARTLPLRQNGLLYARAAQRVEALNQDPPPPGAAINLPGDGLLILPGIAAAGVSVSPQPVTEVLQKSVLAAAEFITMPMRWIDLEPVEGQYSFGPTDRWIEWAIKVAKIPVVGGPLIDFRPTCIPEWLYIWENDYETLRELVHDHVQAVVTRYRRTVSRWTVISGVHANTHFKLSPEQVMDLTRICVLVVKKLHPQSRVQVEVAQPWGEYFSANRRSIPPLLYAETLVQAGVPFDLLGVRLQLSQPQPGQATRDLMAISSLLDRFAQIERPLAVTALGAPSETIAPAPMPGKPSSNPFAEDSSDEASGPLLNPGSWRRAWSPASQADWAAQVLAICAAKPFVANVCWQELADPLAGDDVPEMRGGGLVASTGQPKPALMKFAAFRQAMREGRPVPIPPIA